MNRTEATAVYAILMFALAAGTLQHWAVNSPRVKALIAAHHYAMAAPQAPELAELRALPAMEDLGSAKTGNAVAAVDRAQMIKALKAAKLCNRTEIKLAMAQVRAAARQVRSQQRELRRQWIMVTPAQLNVHVEPAQIEISNP